MPRGAANACRTSGRRPAFHGGWALYLGYELAGQVEPVLRLPRRPARCRWRWRCAARRRSRATATAAAACWCASRAPRARRRPRRATGRRARLPPLPEWQPPLAVHEDDPARFLAGVRSRARIPARRRHLPGQPLAQVERGVRAAPGAGGAVRAPARGQSRALRRPARLRGLGAGQFLAGAAGSVRGRSSRPRPIAGTRARLPGDDDAARVGELVAIPRNAPST
jgi:anthranilate synthase component 1